MSFGFEDLRYDAYHSVGYLKLFPVLYVCMDGWMDELMNECGVLLSGRKIDCGCLRMKRRGKWSEKREKVRGYRELHSDEFRSLYSSPGIRVMKIIEYEIGETRRTSANEKCIGCVDCINLIKGSEAVSCEHGNEIPRPIKGEMCFSSFSSAATRNRMLK
jgi:hypothetical protein